MSKTILCAGVVIAFGCTRRNPEVCCTSASDCQAQELPFPTSCAAGLTCVKNLCTASVADAGVDTLQTDAAMCVGVGIYEVCLSSLPTSGVSLQGGTINTDVDPMCLSTQPAGWTTHGQPEACFIVGTNVSVSGVTHATGMRPLVIIATNSLDVSSMVDVSSNTARSQVGAGWDQTKCLSSVQSPTGTSGGAGGTFTTSGGQGGASGGNAGLPSSVTTPTTLRGGCDGQAGHGTGISVDNTAGGVGHGGGAVYLASMNTLNLMAGAVVNASGGGGDGGHSNLNGSSKVGGGGGGGSGGMIVLYATTITMDGTAVILANGGGGGAGDDGSVNAAATGQDPSTGFVTTPASGGNGPGGAGGNGFAGTIAATNGAASSSAGGGGGGGAGYIRTNVPLIGGAGASPTPVVIP